MIKNHINLITNILSMMIIILSSYITIPIITSNLTISAYNYVALINNFILFFSVLGFTLNSMLGKFYTVALQNSRQESNKYLSSAFFSVLFLFIVSTPIILYIIYNLSNIISISNEIILDVQIAFLLSYVSLFFTTTLSILNVIPYSLNKLTYINWNSIFTNVVRILSVFSLFYFLEPKIWYVGFSNLLQSCMAIIISLYFVKKLNNTAKITFKNFKWSFSYLLISSGILNSIILLGNTLMIQTDLLIGNQFLDSVIMGSFAVLLSFSTTVRSFSTAVSTSFSPVTTKLYSQDKQEEMIAHIRKAIHTTSLLTYLPITLICVVGTKFLEIWLDYDFSNFQSTLFIMMIPLGICLSFNQLNVLFQTYDKLKFPAIITIVSGFLTIIFSYYLGRVQGINGIIFASTLMFLLKSAVILPIYASKLLKSSIIMMYTGTILPTISCIISIFVIRSIFNRINAINYFDVILFSLISIIFYFLLHKILETMLLNRGGLRNG